MILWRTYPLQKVSVNLQPLLHNPLLKLPTSVKYATVRAITTFKAILDSCNDVICVICDVVVMFLSLRVVGKNGTNDNNDNNILVSDSTCALVGSVASFGKYSVFDSQRRNI